MMNYTLLLKLSFSKLPLTVNELCSGLSHLYVVILVSAPLQPTLNTQRARCMTEIANRRQKVEQNCKRIYNFFKSDC